MKKNKNKNPENDDGQNINYEDLLNDFISDNEKSIENGVEEGFVLDELLAGIESQDEIKSSDKKIKTEDEEVFDLSMVPIINLDDLSFDNDEEKSSPAKKKNKFEIDLGGIDTSRDIDYASILSEIDETENISASDKKNESEVPEMIPSEIELEIKNKSLYESLIEDEPEEQPVSEPVDNNSMLKFSLDDLISDSVDSGQNEENEPTESKPESDITASYEALINGLSDSDTEKEHEAPELEPEPVITDDSYKIDESEYDSISDDEDIMKAYNSASSGDEDEITLLDGSASSLDDDGILTIEKSLNEDETDFLKAYETEETIQLEALKDEPLEQEEPDQTETATQAFVIPGMDSDDDEDFLNLNIDEPAPKKEDGLGMLAGIADVKVTALNEVLMPGIDMDARDQVEAVTRAEVFLAQGKKKEAAEIYASLVKKKGATPFVLKRLKELA